MSVLIDIWDNRLIPGFIDSKDHPLASTFYHSENTACMDQVGAVSISYIHSCFNNNVFVDPTISDMQTSAQ